MSGPSAASTPATSDPIGRGRLARSPPARSPCSRPGSSRPPGPRSSPRRDPAAAARPSCSAEDLGATRIRRHPPPSRRHDPPPRVACADGSPVPVRHRGRPGRCREAGRRLRSRGTGASLGTTGKGARPWRGTCWGSTSRAASSTRRCRSGSRRRSPRTWTTTRRCTELVASGELVDSTVLTGPDLAKIVTSDGRPRRWSPTARSRSSRSGSPGYQIVDVESEARAIEIAARVSAVPGPGGAAPSSRSRSAR